MSKVINYISENKKNIIILVLILFSLKFISYIAMSMLVIIAITASPAVLIAMMILGPSSD